IVLGAGALTRFRPADQHDLATAAAAGTAILTVALAEEHNWEPGRPQTTASEAAGGWRVSGVKTTVPVADRATRILVPANVSGVPAVFLVDPSHESVTVTAQQVTDRSAESLVEFADSPAELLGTVADGAQILDWLLDRAWLGLAAQQLGILERSLDLVAGYAREREQFGRTIGGFQAVAQRLSDGYISIQGLRLTVTQAAWQLAEGLDATAAIHTAKFWAAEAGHEVAHTLVHVHGGVGIDRDHIAHNYFTAAKHNEFALGGATNHLLPLAQDLPDSA
ncbi:MAG: acyl-CoA dehydrogenase family protein, partial [Stackebrandtia sp.]